ncbi:MAG: TonB-dependent receptor [Proteobacteria bacterium]|nr:TonB-dependent receptor [Pseudomonadota bacterium]MDA0992289.1 TonB-dependent receptor [Pseudomonadota bacterium]
MNNRTITQKGTPHIVAAISILVLLSPASAEEENGAVDDTEEAIEEVVVTGRFISSSQQLVNERMTDAFATDLLGADTIARLGDSTVGAALRRIPGLSLVDDKYVYIRGLGERYSASSLSGAQIPSPDLTRNVIPLDVFPTSIVESLRVQKSWSPDLPANFGGGAIDIRTKGIPDGFIASFEVGSGSNSEASGSGLSYQGGSDDKWGTDDGTRALSTDLQNSIDLYQGEIGVQSLLSTLRGSDQTVTLADAQALNRSLGTELNRNIAPQDKSLPADVSLRGSIGNNWMLREDWEFGAIVSAAYQTNWRNTIAEARNFNFPDERTDTEKETTQSVTMAGTASFGLKFLDEHEIETTTLWLRNTDDETAVTDYFNENREKSDGLGWRNYRFQLEERSMLTNQIRGSHYLSDSTRDRLPDFVSGLVGSLPTETEITWFFSDSTAQTEIPNQLDIASQTTTDPATGAVLNEAVTLSSQAAAFRFTDLDDEVQNYGWAATVPFETRRTRIELSGGWQHARKVRTYQQTQFSLGALSVADPATLELPLDQVFSDSVIQDPANNFVFDRQGANNESYFAATMTDGVFGAIDWTLDDTWRIAAGARWEDYRQAAVNWNPFGYSEADPQVTTDPEELRQGVVTEDKVYPSAALTYMSDLWAETFQLRFGWSETAVRPDLREITGSSYIDPITGDLTRGNPGVTPSAVTNYDVRGEWFFGNGDNLTVTLFKKDIDKPIEFFESAASDTTIAREILNSNEATVEGLEVEFLKALGFIGGPFETLFVQGNVTMQNSELVCDANAADFACEADAPTNPVRPLSGASDYVANFMLGFDSPDSKHTASIMFNVFGERLYVAGRNGSPDGYEQPFNSLDLTYFWYPTDTMTLKLKAQNVLNETITIERDGVVVFEEDPGTTISLSFNWSL